MTRKHVRYATFRVDTAPAEVIDRTTPTIDRPMAPTPAPPARPALPTPLHGRFAAAMGWVRQRPLVWGIGLAAAGLAIGLLVGWVLWPVQWTDVSYPYLGVREKAAIVEAASDLNAYDTTSPAVTRLMHGWASDSVACQLAAQTDDANERMRLISLAYRINGNGCGE